MAWLVSFTTVHMAFKQNIKIPIVYIEKERKIQSPSTVGKRLHFTLLTGSHYSAIYMPENNIIYMIPFNVTYNVITELARRTTDFKIFFGAYGCTGPAKILPKTSEQRPSNLVEEVVAEFLQSYVLHAFQVNRRTDLTRHEHILMIAMYCLDSTQIIFSGCRDDHILYGMVLDFF